MSKFDDLTAAVAANQAAQAAQLTAIDTEIKQLADVIAAGNLSPADAATLQAAIDNISAATTAMQDSTAKLTADDPTA